MTKALAYLVGASAVLVALSSALVLFSSDGGLSPHQQQARFNCLAGQEKAACDVALRHASQDSLEPWLR